MSVWNIYLKEEMFDILQLFDDVPRAHGIQQLQGLFRGKRDLDLYKKKSLESQQLQGFFRENRDHILYKKCRMDMEVESQQLQGLFRGKRGIDLYKNMKFVDVMSMSMLSVISQELTTSNDIFKDVPCNHFLNIEHQQINIINLIVKYRL